MDAEIGREFRHVAQQTGEAVLAAAVEPRLAHFLDRAADFVGARVALPSVQAFD